MLVVALKLAEDIYFLPGDEDDLHEFLSCNTMDQIFFCKSYLLFEIKREKSIQDIQKNKSYRKYNKWYPVSYAVTTTKKSPVSLFDLLHTKAREHKEGLRLDLRIKRNKYVFEVFLYFLTRQP